MSRPTTAPTLWLPPAANAVTPTPGNAAWVPSGWVTITTGLVTPAYLTRVMIIPSNGDIGDSHNQVQVAIGASGSEVVKITHRSRYSDNQFGNKATQNFPLAYGPIPSGTRIAVRVAHSLTADTATYRVALGYQAIAGGMSDITDLVQTVDPIDSGSLTLTGATWPTWGDWGELLSAAEVGAGGVWIKGIIPGSQLTSNIEYQIGTGAAAAEVAKCTVPSDGNSATVGPTYIRLPHALFIPANTRVVARCRSDTGTSPSIHVWYAPRA